MTYRWKEHVGPEEDFHLGYRTEKEAEQWMNNDQLKCLGEMIDPKLKNDIEREVEAEIIEAFEFAERSKFPDPSELNTDVFKEK